MTNENYKNSYIAKEKELVSLSVYNVGFQKCASLHQWGPGIRNHYLIHHIISGKGTYEINHKKFQLRAGDTFLAYPNTEITYYADEKKPWEYAWVGFSGSDASMLLSFPWSIHIFKTRHWAGKSTRQCFRFMRHEAVRF